MQQQSKKKNKALHNRTPNESQWFCEDVNEYSPKKSKHI